MADIGSGWPSWVRPVLVKITPVDPVTGRRIGKTRVIWPLPKRPTHAADRTVSRRKAAGRRRTKHHARSRR